MPNKKAIQEKVHCGACGSNSDILIPSGTVVIDGKIVDSEDKVYGRPKCPHCQAGDSLCSIDL